MIFDIDDKTFNSIKTIKDIFIVKQVESVWWKIHSFRLWSGEVDSASENLDEYTKYDYQGLDIFVNKNIDDDNTLNIRVNPYLQKGVTTYRALLMGFKETVGPYKGRSAGQLRMALETGINTALK